MVQSDCGRDKMAGTVAAICLLLLVAPACRGGLPQDEKYTTRSDLHTHTYTYIKHCDMAVARTI